MTSYPADEACVLFDLDPKEVAVANLISSVGDQIQHAFSKRKITDGMTQQKLARIVGVDRSRINRCLSGSNNLTLETVAELAFALRAAIDFKLTLEDTPAPSCNHFKPSIQEEQAKPKASTASEGGFLFESKTAVKYSGGLSSVPNQH